MRPIDKLDETIKDLVHFISERKPEELEFSPRKKWRMREIFIHIVFWHEQYAAITHSFLNKSQPDLLTGSFKENNQIAVEKNRNTSVEVLIKRLNKAQKYLFDSYDKATEFDIAFKEGGKVRSYPDAIGRIESHIRSHLERMKRRIY